MKVKFRVNKVYSQDILYDAALVIYLILSVLDLSVIDISSLFLPLSILAIGLLIFRFILIRELSLNSMTIIAIISLITIVAYFKSGRSWFYPYTMLFILLGNKINIKHTLKIFCITESVLLLILTALALSRKIPNILYYRVDAISHSLVVRQSLGFNNTNTFCFVALQIGVCVLLILGKKASGRHVFLFVLWIFIIESITRNYSLLVCTAVFIITYLLSKIADYKVIRRLFYFLACLPIFLSVFSLLLTVKFSASSSFFMAINSLTSGRIQLWNTCYRNYGFSLFGNAMEFGTFGIVSQYRIVLDNAYLQLAMRSGIVSLIFFIAVITAMNFWTIRSKEYVIFALSTAMFTLGFTETAAIILCMNAVLLFAPVAIYSDYYSKVREAV